MDTKQSAGLVGFWFKLHLLVEISRSIWSASRYQPLLNQLHSCITQTS